MAGSTHALFRQHGCRRARSRSRLLGRTALCGALSLGVAGGLLPRAVEAEPQGTVIVGGAVDVSRSGTHTEFTQRSQTALLNHRSFDIGANESVNFAQPSASALAVNRVVGSDLPTSIAGKLTANGNVWVLNPSGVAIRGTAQVNVGGLLATTASISDEAILAGERSFSGAPAGSAVSNAGAIEAGQGGVVLVAPVVSNTGTIRTSGSDVALGAGSGFTVDFDGDGLTRFEVSPGSGVSITNAGTISAEGGAAYISAASADAVQTSVVSIGGRVEATRVENRGGVIYISGGERGVTEVAGTLDARQSAGEGGRIAVTGDRVDIAPMAVLDASGAGSGGRIEIGGGLRGAPIASPVLARSGAPATAPLPSAKRTVVRQGARLAANAGAEGDGGTVIVWADEATGFRGAIEARGGALAGNGGFAEVSGRQALSFDGAVDLTAATGATGTLLLDPDSVTIVAGAQGDAPQDGQLLDHLIDANDLPASFTISAGAVAASVATADTLVEARQSITQQADITLSGTNSLTYGTQTGDITLNAAVIGPGNALIIEAGGDVLFAGGASTLGSLRVEASDSIGQSAAGGLTVSGTSVLHSTGDIALDLAANNFASVDLSGESVRLADANALQLGNIQAAELTISAGGSISQRPGTTITVPGDSSIGTTAGGIALSRPTNDFADEGSGHAVMLTAPGAIALVDTDSVALGPSSGAGLAVTADDLSITGALEFGATVTLTNGAGDLALVGVGAADLDGATFEITDAELALIDAQAIAVTTTGVQGIEVQGVTLDAEGLTLQSGAGPTSFTTGPTYVPGDLGVTGASITQDASGAIAVDGKTALSASGAIALTNAENDFDADAPPATAADEVDATGTAIALADRDAIALGTIDAASLGVSAGGRLTDTAGKAIRVTGPSDLVAQSGGALFDIALDGNGSPSDRPHDFGTVGARGANVVLHDMNAVALGAISTSAGLTVRAGGGITDTPGQAILVGARTDLTAQGGSGRFDIALDNAATHDFAGRVDAVGRDIAFVDRSAIALGAIDASSLAVSAGGPVADTPGETIRVAGPTAIAARSGGALFDIGLDNPATHDFGGPVAAQGASVVLHDASGIALGAIAASNLTVRASGSIIDAPGASILVGGTTDLAAEGGVALFDIVLDNPATHDFGAVNARGANVVLQDAGAIALGTVEASSLAVTAGGPILDAPGGAVTVPGPTTLTAKAGGAFFDIALDGSGAAMDRPHDFGTVNAQGANVILHDVNTIALGAIGAANLTVSAGGSITDTPGAAIVVPGETDLVAQTGAEFFDIALDGNGAVPSDRPHDFGVVDARGEDIVLHDRNAIVLGAIDANESGQEAATGAPDGTLARYDNDGDGLLTAADPAAAGDLTVRAGDGIADTGPGIDVEGRTRLEARDGAARFDIALDGPNDFDSNAVGPDAAHEVDAIGANVTLVDRDAIALGGIAASGLTVRAGGSITDTPGEAILVPGTTDLAAASGGDFFDIALDNPGTHDLGSVSMVGEGIRVLDRQDLTIIGVDSLADGAPDATLPGDGIYLQVDQGGFAFAPGRTVPLDAVLDITLLAPNGSFDADPDPSVVDQRMPDGLTFRSTLGNITLDLRDGFVVEDVRGTTPFTLDAANGISRIRIGEGGEAGEPQFFGIGTADFLQRAREPGFNPFFDLASVGDLDLFRVTGDFGLIARAPLTVRIQNTRAVASTGQGTVIVGTTYLGGRFAAGGLSMFGTFADSDGEIASIEGFRDARFIGEIPYFVQDSNTANGCTILVPTSCQPIGSLLPNLGYREGLLLGIKFVAPGEDLDDPFTNRGDEEGWD